MYEAYKCLAVIIFATASIAADCPQIHKTGVCTFQIQCRGAIRNVTLPNECRGSVNYPVNVDLTLENAIERFDDHIDKEFFRTITSFKATAAWHKTSLSILTYMPRLRSLSLTDDHIKEIDGNPFLKLKDLLHLDLSRNSLSDIAELFMFEDQPNSLERLFLSHNAIEEIPGYTFSELISLKELDLSHNLISSLDEEPFSNLTNLVILRLNNNKIKDLNGAVNNLINLKHLYLRGNQIQNIDEPSLQIIKHLVIFDVSENQLEHLKPIMFLRHWKHGVDVVCKIILSENHITTVPNGISKEISDRYTREINHKVDVNHKVKVLTELDLSKNKISKIGYNAFQSIIQLTKLDLSKNNLTDFIVNSDDLKNITYLNLSYNLISTLFFKSFSSMVHLQDLDLSHNKLDYIPDQTFVKNHNLKNVNMTFNGLKVVQNFPVEMFHPDGGVLDLSNNGLSKLELPFGGAIRLTVLVLNSNKLKDAASVNLLYQNELKYLEMNKNEIKQLNASSLKLPFYLTYLDLRSNSIEDIGPSTFHRVPHLKSLYLGDNKLKQIQYGAFQGLNALTSLDLSFNNIKQLDSKVLIDLKSLTVLSLRSNGFDYLDYKGWFGHKFYLKVYVDGNDFTCDWLGQALKDYNNGFSRMKPTIDPATSRAATSKNSLEGIPCIQNESEKLIDLGSSSGLADERLLLTNQKILAAVKEQTYFLRSLLYQFNHNLNVSRTLFMQKLSLNQA